MKLQPSRVDSYVFRQVDFQSLANAVAQATNSPDDRGTVRVGTARTVARVPDSGDSAQALRDESSRSTQAIVPPPEWMAVRALLPISRSVDGAE